MTELNDYQKVALSTAIFPRNKDGLTLYPVLGLCGESGEVAGAWMRVKVGSEDTELLVKEVGDVLWYTAVLAEELSATLLQVAEIQGKTTFADFAVKPLEEEEVDFAVWELSEAAGMVAEKAKKAVRDTDGVLSEAAREVILTKLSSVLSALSSIASITGVDLAEIARINSEKLLSRQQRGVLQGSGDKR